MTLYRFVSEVPDEVYAEIRNRAKVVEKTTREA